MVNQVLTIDQMRELKELGIDTSKASMCYCSLESDEYNFGNNVIVPNDDTLSNCGLYKENVIPTFTLQDILEMLPVTIKQYAVLQMWKDINNEYHFQYICETQDLDSYYQSPDFYNTSILNAAFSMLKWLIENKFI